ncbi:MULTISPECIES: DNA repair protein RecN [Nitrospirillum]|uniref:DNA repair protein RecN n=1 Tax=Nitrospirillum amazonense TaxID=28077 RepID=A0A560FZB1_9PROT|nr:DNA repair protein RecN [Nitrospirillum amazonense]MEC4595095.1 DNA repair protein RecN [Nitrospirillum amazonense]TWB26977.1 DNA replication and repair protein RecN [Nitrospirillum amazonense]
MLASLSIRDVVLIERLNLSFGQGLCVLTGETGAGKSILLDALGLALGGRGDSGLVRHGADQATVVAEFDLAARGANGGSDHPALALLREQDLDADTTLVLRRTVTADGRSRAFINDQPVGVALLRRVGETLVEVHGQFDTHGLLNPLTHRDLLDDYAGLAPKRAQLSGLYRAWQAAEAARADADREAARAREEEEYVRHALSELDALDPKDNEEEALAEKRAVMMHREKLVEALTGAAGDISGERGAERAIANALRHLTRVADKAAGQLDPLIAVLDQAAAEIGEAARTLQVMAGDMDHDGASLEKLEERLFALRACARKHGIGVSGLATLRADFARRLSLIEDQGDLLTRLAKDAAEAKQAYAAAASSLTEERRRVAGKLDRAVMAELAPLKLEKARFVTAVEPVGEAEWGPGGSDRVAFTVATNPGAPPGPLAKIASGGELARFMLALKVILAQVGTVPTLVFDEVDTGIGGAVANAVGERLARLGAGLQVLVVTHSPQVAARGQQHLNVRKRVAAGKTTTDVVILSPEERREEIARMLSGAEITAAARAAASELMAAG